MNYIFHGKKNRPSLFFLEKFIENFQLQPAKSLSGSQGSMVLASIYLMIQHIYLALISAVDIM
jgi:hypothetical protein